MSETTKKPELKTARQQENERLHLQNSIETVLDMEQSFKLYSYRIIDTKTFKEGIEQIMHVYASRSERIDQEHPHDD